MTKIEWTHRAGTKGESWNPIKARNKKTGGIGHFCTKVSKGCNNCYAANFQPRFKNPVRYAKQDADQVEIFLDETVLMQPLRWNKPRTIFVCSMTDLFYEGHPIEWLWRVWAVMALAPQHTFIVLTKRISHANTALVNRLRMGDPDICKAINQIPAFLGNRKGALEMPLPNVWIGTSVEDQATADHRIPHLLNTPAAVRFLSVEPLLGKIVLHDDWLPPMFPVSDPLLPRSEWGSTPIHGLYPHIDWIICGGESGLNARPMHPDWARSLRDQCKTVNVPFFFKQWGAWLPWEGADAPFWLSQNGGYQDGHSLFPCDMESDPDWDDGLSFVSDDEAHVVFQKVGKKVAGRLLDGQEHDAFPEAL